MLVAHVEQEGVWLVEGGMHRLAAALAGAGRAATAPSSATARRRARSSPRGGRVAGVRLADGERLEADAVVVNGDVAAVAGGLLGSAVAGAVPATPRARARSRP